MRLRHIKEDFNRLKQGGGVTGYQVDITLRVYVNAENKKAAHHQIIDDDIPKLLQLTLDNNQYPNRLVSVKTKRLED